ncbi:hypothetical protein Q7499_05915 [Glaesserella parasuis]|nr:hypothetical protein [Glaesserella parasuis]MDO9833709.1 hypothetical protein [Glaesserella parasuis]
MDKFDRVIIPYGDQHFTVRLVKNAKYKRLRLTVQPTGDIIAYAPPQAVRNELIFPSANKVCGLPTNCNFSNKTHRLLNGNISAAKATAT